MASSAPTVENTCFAPAARVGPIEVAREAAQIAASPMVDALLAAAGGLLAVLDERRQIVALNAALLEALGVDDPTRALGLRLGEAAGCVHAADNPGGGCGTGPYCSSCGAAIAIVTALAEDRTVERICSLAATRDDAPVDLYLSVRARPLAWDGARWLLLFLRDISAEQELCLLQRVFFHDLANLVTALSARSHRLLAGDLSLASRLQVETVDHVVARVAEELAVQRLLFDARAGALRPAIAEVAVEPLLRELAATCHAHPAAHGKRLACRDDPGAGAIATDRVLLERVVTNMLVNAFEATPVGGEVELACERHAGSVVFRVSNPGHIPADVVGRIFQRNFSSKGGVGRGLGTYAMKLLGEKILGGAVDFASRDGHTVFTLTLPAPGPG